MRAALQADESIVKWEPLRKILDKPDPGPGRVRIGPDWTALAGNWWCEWERENDDYYLNRIKTGMVSSPSSVLLFPPSPCSFFLTPFPPPLGTRNASEPCCELRLTSTQHDIGEMKYGMWSGYTAAVNWDPATGHLQDIGGEFEAT